MKNSGVWLGVVAGLFLCVGSAWGDGSEALGPPSIAVASGTGIVAAGTGMISQPGMVTVEVPEGATVKQVLLYWEGFMASNVAGDNTIDIGGGVGPVTGILIGGPTFFFSEAYASTFRADITSLDLVGPGSNTLMLSGLDFSTSSNGAGVVVIFDDGSSDAEIDMRDGSDLAFINFGGDLQGTVAQTFTFPASDANRTAMLNLFFASVSGTTSGGALRPSSIEVTTSGSGAPSTTVFSNVLDSIDGQEWDSFTLNVNVPPGDNALTVQAFSRDDMDTGALPASMDWLAAAFALEPEEPPQVPGRMTGGGSVFTIDGARVTRGFEIHCDLREPNNLEVNWPGGNKFHLDMLTGAVCTDSPAIDQNPPKAPFDTFEGFGTGRFNRTQGATIEFVFVDAGEPGSSDTASIKIWDANGNLVLDVPGDPSVPGYLDKGNIQAHKDNKSAL